MSEPKLTDEELAAEIESIAGVTRYFSNPPSHSDIIQQAANRLRELAADKRRLDWLEARLTGASDSERYLPFRVYWGQTRNIRAAIDKAMESKA